MSQTINSADRAGAAECPDDSFVPEVSIVMPCLDEAETLAVCIDKAQRAFRNGDLDGEVIIADNGSTDGSQMIAMAHGARVVHVEQKGYGNALRGGISAARGCYVIFGDADDSYDFLDAPRFVEKLREGYDLVMGNRFRGGIKPGAMPWKHRYIGNPVLSGLGRLFFGCPVKDFHCGLRGLSKAAYEQMELCTTGMEFASEMVIKATLKEMRITEIPTVLSPDGRSRPPHLRSWRDGWRHLRFMLLLTPTWLFLLPAVILFLCGLVTGLFLLSGPIMIGPAGFDIHTLLLAGLAMIIGQQLMIFAAYTKWLAVLLGLHGSSRWLQRAGRWCRLEAGIVCGTAMFGTGLGGVASIAWSWQQAGFGPLDAREVMRWVIPASVLIALGVQTIFGSFFLGFLQLAKQRLTATAG